jgi:putative oxidoreductase
MLDSIRSFFETVQDFPDIPLLLMRVVVGLVFVVAARNKLKDVAEFAKGNGLPVPIAWLSIFAEIAGGVGIALGILPQVAALIIMGLMSGSMYFHIVKWKSKYWAASGGWEYDLMLFTMASVILVTGGGDIALYTML